MVFLPHTGQGWVIEVNGENWLFDSNARLIGRPDPDTYDPCWCGSATKFRFCHLNRHREPRVTKQEYLVGWEAAADVEMCLHPLAPTGCAGSVIRAHTVQRMGGGLRAIARDGEVYGFKLHPHFFQKHGLIVVPELLGTRQASTFRGFCAAHDAELFKPAEHHPFAGTSSQVGLLNFRAVARRLYGRHVAVRHAPIMLEYDRGLPPHVQREWFAIQHRETVKAQQTLQNVQELKAGYDRLVVSGDFSNANAYILWFKGRPEFLCAELVSIDYDFEGRSLQEPDPPAHLCVYNLAVGDRWAFVFGWVGANSAAAAMATSLENREDADKPAAVLRYALEYTDNIFFGPEWWDSLPQPEKAWVSFILTSRMHPHYLRDRDLLLAKIGVPMTSTYLYAEKLGPWSAAT